MHSEKIKLITLVFVLVSLLSCSKTNDDTVDELEITCPTNGNLIINRQEQIDTLSFTKVPGELRIEGTLINDLSGLSQLRSVGSLSVTNTLLTNLNGLGNLTEICTGKFYMRDNPNLTDVTALTSIGTKLREVEIKRCASLQDLSGLNLAEEADRLVLSGSFIKNLDAFNNVKNLGVFILYDLPNLKSIQGLRGLETVSTRLEFSKLPNLSSFQGLNNLVSVQSTLEFVDDIGVQTFEGLESLKSAGGIVIRDLDSLVRLDGFNGLEEVGGITVTNCDQLAEIGSIGQGVELDYIQISDLPSLTSLSGLSGVINMRNFAISNCPNLTSLSGLDNWNGQRGETIRIRNMDSLENISALGNLFGTFESISLIDLPMLSSLESFSGISGRMSQISLIDLPELSSLLGLDSINSVRTFTLENVGIPSFVGLSSLQNAETLDISECSRLINLDGSTLVQNEWAGPFNSTRLFIHDNPLLNNFCGISNFANSNPYFNTYIVGNNYNPTIEQIRSATECSN